MLLKEKKNKNLKKKVENKPTQILNKNKYKKQHRFGIKKPYSLHQILGVQLALKRALFNFKKEVTNEEETPLSIQAKLKEKREKFLIKYIIKNLQKKGLKNRLEKKLINPLKFKYKNTNKRRKLSPLLIRNLNKTNALILPKRGSIKYQFLINKAINKFNIELTRIKNKLFELNKKDYGKMRMNRNRRKYQKRKSKREKNLEKKELLLKKYLKLTKQLPQLRVIPKKRNKNWKNNIKISYEPSVSGKSLIKVVLRINRFLHNKSIAIQKQHKMKKKFARHFDYLVTQQQALLNTAVNSKVEQQFSY